MNAAKLAEFWSGTINEFLESGKAVPDELTERFGSYNGAGNGEPQKDALPEPWLRQLTSTPRAVFLQLNPGKANPRQLRDGWFARQIRQMGCYSKWAALPPYWIDGELEDDDPSLSGLLESKRFWKYSKKFSRERLKFAQTWFNDPSTAYGDVLMFELYPWHSKRLSKRLQPPLRFVREYIWEPIADLGCQIVFAFGSAWFEVLPQLDIETFSIPRPSFRVDSREVLFGRNRESGTWIMAEKRKGSAGPPAADEVCIIRDAFEELAVRH